MAHHMVDWEGLMEGGCMETTCIEEVMVVGFMEVLACTEGVCTMVVLEAQWVVMGWAWGVLMAIKIRIIHLVLRHLHQGFGYHSCGCWKVW
ncbi:hypothetical protein CsSME_00041371 [Camellia sinensis var. sinensis]